MANLTLLDMVQSILSDMNSDQVNSISDTEEALQVANILKDTFHNIINDHDIPSTRKRIQLNASGDPALPTHMTFDGEVTRIETVFYDSRQSLSDPLAYREVCWMEPVAFLRFTASRSSTEANIDSVVDATGTTLLIRNDKAPEYYTSFDDTAIVFDSYNSALESTLQSSKTICYALVRPVWQLDDEYVPELPEHLQMLLLNEAKSFCFVTIKQMANPKAEQHAQRSHISATKKKQRVRDNTRWGHLPYPDFGRR